MFGLISGSKLRFERLPSFKVLQAPPYQIVGAGTFAWNDIRPLDRHPSLRVNERQLHCPSRFSIYKSYRRALPSADRPFVADLQQRVS